VLQTITAGELATRFGCELRGDPAVELRTVATLAGAGPGSLSFLANPAYRGDLRASGASAIIVSAKYADECPCTALVADDPYVTYARAAAALHPPRRIEPGIHPTAVVADDAHIDPSASVAAHAVIESGASIGAGSSVGAGCFVGRGSRIGPDCRIAPNVTIMDSVTIGQRAVLHSGVVIGSDGFGIARAPEGWIKVPQVGGVRIGDDVEIGASTSIDRGAIDDTVIGNGVKLDNQIQIGHNSIIGDHTVMAGMVGIAGSSTIGSNCAFGGNSGTAGHLTVTDNVVITARCTVMSDITEAGTYGGAFPHEPFRDYQRNLARYRQLDKLARRLQNIEKKIDQDA
jgi:UDP-3-O-[3-hydroxymyristoyl] glucosamine N-acyltransferase